MSKPITVTYELFATAALELEKDGQRISVRTIRDKIGGANSRLMEFLRHWRAEKQLASMTDEDMSKVFHQALLAEFGRVVQKTKTILEEQLAAEKVNTQEALDLLSETEKHATNLDETIVRLQQVHEKTVTSFEKKVAALEARLADTMAREADLTKKFETTQNKLHEANIEGAVLKERCAVLEKQHSTKDKSIKRT